MSETPKEFPQNYSSDVVKILETMSFTKGKSVALVGSQAVRSQIYASDFDGFEVVKVSAPSKEAALNSLVKQFQDIIKALRGMPNCFIGEFKAGSKEEWRVFPTAQRLEQYNASKALEKAEELQRKKLLTRDELRAMNQIKPTLSPAQFLKLRHDLRPHIVRWTPAEILAGHKRLRDGSTMTLQQAFESPTIAKLDVIGFIQNNKFAEFSILYEFQWNGTVLNPVPLDVEQALLDDIELYKGEGDWFKTAKRMFSLAKFKNDKRQMEKLLPLLNSDAGLAYVVAGDIRALLALLEEGVKPSKKIRFEIDQFVGRLGNIYSPRYLKLEPKVLGHIRQALHSHASLMKEHLYQVESELAAFYNYQAGDYLGKNGLK